MEDIGNKESKIRKYRLDIIVIAALLVISLSVLLAVKLTRKDGAAVKIEIDGRTVGEYPLDLDGEYTLNGGTNVLKIEDGRAYMIHSDCPDHTCERTGKISYAGQTIVCLPNKVSVTVIGTTEDSVDFTS